MYFNLLFGESNRIIISSTPYDLSRILLNKLYILQTINNTVYRINVIYRFNSNNYTLYEIYIKTTPINIRYFLLNTHTKPLHVIDTNRIL